MGSPRAASAPGNGASLTKSRGTPDPVSPPPARPGAPPSRRRFESETGRRAESRVRLTSPVPEIEMDIVGHNRRAWDRQVEQRNRWTIPVTPEVVEAARHGEWEIFLTPSR